MGIMQVDQFYEDLLGIKSPWSIKEVDYSLGEQEVHVFLKYTAGSKFACPECELLCSVYDHQEDRTWRHLDTMQMMTYLHAPVPRVRCPQHGVKVIRFSWAEKRSQFTLLFERLAIDLLRSCAQDSRQPLPEKTLQQGGKLLG